VRIGIASEWIGQKVGGPERYAVCLIESLLRTDSANSYHLFVTPSARQQLMHLERPVGVALLRLVMVAVALDATAARAAGRLVAVAARADRRHQHVLRLGAGRRLVALHAGQRAVRRVVEARMR